MTEDRNPNTRLVTPDGARRIRERYERGDLSVHQLAKRLGCSPHAVQNLLTGKSYKKAGGPLFPEVSRSGGARPPRHSDDALDELLR